MAAPTVAQVKTRIEAIAATMPGMVTTNMNAVANLSPAQLYALDVIPTVATRNMFTIGGAYHITRTYRLVLFVAQVAASQNNDDLMLVAALEQTYPIADVLPGIFITRPRLELNGNDGIALACEEMSDVEPDVIPFGRLGQQYSILRYDLKVTVEAP